jgi:hypothetical protein
MPTQLADTGEIRSRQLRGHATKEKYNFYLIMGRILMCKVVISETRSKEPHGGITTK